MNAITNEELEVIATDGDQVTIDQTEIMAKELLARRAQDAKQEGKVRYYRSKVCVPPWYVKVIDGIVIETQFMLGSSAKGGWQYLFSPTCDREITAAEYEAAKQPAPVVEPETRSCENCGNGVSTSACIKIRCLVLPHESDSPSYFANWIPKPAKPLAEGEIEPWMELKITDPDTALSVSAIRQLQRRLEAVENRLAKEAR